MVYDKGEQVVRRGALIAMESLSFSLMTGGAGFNYA
jgi:hypothetical protein